MIASSVRWLAKVMFSEWSIVRPIENAVLCDNSATLSQEGRGVQMVNNQEMILTLIHAWDLQYLECGV